MSPALNLLHPKLLQAFTAYSPVTPLQVLGKWK